MIYAMSDIHGCIEAFEEKLKRVDLSGDNRLILLGDYIDYGSASGEVLDRVWSLQQKYGPQKVIVLKGNHEDMLLSWIDDHKGTFINDSWFKTDSDSGFITYKTLVSERSFSDLEEYMKSASYSQINTVAVRILLSEKKKMIDWIRKMPLYYETKDQIFVHAGVDEEAEDMWKWGTPDETFMWKFPATTGPFLKTVIAGHVGTSHLAKDENYHDIYHDGKSHYFIDGSVYKDGKLLLLAYDEKTGEYMQI